jgi:putative endopeptidase
MKTQLSKKGFLLFPLATFLWFSCNNAKQETKEETMEKKIAALDVTSIDTLVKPGDDFYQFVNGNWLKNNPIPSTEKSWGSFGEIDQRNEKALHEILENAAKNTTTDKGSNEQKIGDYYYTAMDSVKRNKEGVTPLKEELAAIDALKTNDDLQPLLARYATMGINPLWASYVTQDEKNSELMVMHISQAGLGLPDCDYYKKSDPQSKALQMAYVDHITKTFTLLGETPANASAYAKKSMEIETRLAKASRNALAQRDPEKRYNKMDMAALSKSTPNVKWEKFFSDLGANQVSYVIVGQPEFLVESGNVLRSMSISDWKIYLRWKLADRAASSLDDAFEMENFNFYSGVLNGVKELEPRWKRSIHAVDAALGEALGQLFVEKYFTEASKKKVKGMVENLIAAYKERIAQVDWMNDSTKAKANEKLNSIMLKLGYPDKWIDYTKLDINRDSYYKNDINSTAFHFKRMIDKLGKPVDRTEWGMTPPTVNAYYNPSMNEIVFPAGIMQPPFFNPDADDALNYGGMGAIIGHELTHGFDDEGNKFDSKGNMVNWWTSSDKKKFEDKTGMIIKQFSGYVVLDTMHVNGALTLGENIADLGGLTISYTAFIKSQEGKKAEKIDGYTPEQRFFIGWARSWRTNYRDEALKQQVLTNPHSPGMFRCNGPLSNMPEFYSAFGLKRGDKMYKEEIGRAKIW